MKRLRLDTLVALDALGQDLEQLGEKGDGSGFGLLVEMKRLSRVAQHGVKATKARTQEEKHTMDRLNLLLQNLRYEQMNLNRQLHNLKAQKAKVPWAELIGIPPGTDLATLSHQAIMERLTTELNERRRLEAEQEKTALLLAELETGNARKREKLAGALQELDLLVERADHVRDKILEPSASSSFSATSFLEAQALPPALYTLYVKASSYLAVFGAAAAATLAITPAPKDSPDAQVYRRHPHRLTLSLQQDKHTLKIFFEYLVELEIVVVAAEGFDENPLRDLFFPDAGLASPNPKNAVIEGFAFNPRTARGFPYRWAQHLCGLQFFPPEAHDVDERSHRHIGDVLDAIRNRFRALGSLKSQLEIFQKLNVPEVPPEVSEQLFPFAARARLIEWKEEKPSESQFKLIRCAFDRSRLKVDAEIAIPFAYPNAPSLFSLRFSNQGAQDHLQAVEASPSVDTSALATQEGEGKHAFFDNNVRAIASELNDFSDELLIPGADRNLLLTLQIKKLQSCIDIYIDSEKKDTLAAMALADKKTRGRDRLKPFRLLPNLGLTHRNQDLSLLP